jgi:hypothetical protein
VAFASAPVRCGGSATTTTSPQKKSLQAAEQEREDVRTARANWKQEQPRLDPSKLIFIDETGTSTNMTPASVQSQRIGIRSEQSSKASHRPSATTTSSMPDMGQNDGIPL